MLMTHVVRVVRIHGLSDGAREFQMRALYATLRSSQRPVAVTIFERFRLGKR